MPDASHIFQSSGDACPICAALAGAEVPAGYKAHDNCMCQTVPVDLACTDECQWTFEHTGNERDGSGPFDVVSGVEVTVICPDGSSAGASIQVDGHGASNLDEWSARLEAAAQDMAEQLCADCPKPEPFLCC